MRGSASGCSIQHVEIGDVLAGCDRQVHIAGAEDVYDLERHLLAIDQNAGGLLAGRQGFAHGVFADEQGGFAGEEDENLVGEQVAFRVGCLLEAGAMVEGATRQVWKAMSGL